MSTFTVSRGGKSYNVQASSQAEADALVDEKLSLEGDAPTKFKVSRNGQSFDVDASSQEEADALIDEKLALETIRSTTEADKREADKRDTLDAMIGTGKGVADVGIASLGLIPTLMSVAPKLINDLGASGYNAILERIYGDAPVPEELKRKSYDESINSALNSAGLPSGSETPAGRMAQGALGGAAGLLNAKSAAELLNKGLTPNTTIGRVAEALSDKPKTQLIGLGAGALAGGTAESAGLDPLSSGGIGLLTNVLAARGYQNWGQVEKAIADGKISDQDRAYLLQMAQKYPILTQTIFPFKSKTMQSVQQLAEVSPAIGTAGMVARETAGRAQAMEDTLNAFNGQRDIGALFKGASADWIKGRGARISGLEDKKQTLIDDAENAANAKPLNVSEATNLIGTIQGTLAKANNPTLSRYIDSLESLKTALNTSDVRGIELNRKILSDMRKDASLGNVSDTVGPYTRKLYTVVAKTLRTAIEDRLGTEASDEWKTINSALSESADDLKAPFFKGTLNKGAKDPRRIASLVDYATDAEDPELMKKMLSDMTPAGKDMLSDATLIRAFVKAGAGADRNISKIDEEQLADNLRKLYGASGLSFTPEKLAKAKAMAQVALTFRPEPGVPNYPRFGIHIGDWLGFIPASVFMRVYNSTPVKNILIKMKDLDINSPSYKNLSRILNQAWASQLRSDNSDTGGQE